MAKTLSGTLVESLRTRIVNGDIASGEKLPSEPRLAAEHQVSRTVVREAIARLNLEGLVHTRRGSGSYALTPPADDADGAPQLARSLDDRLALVEYRLALEAEAAALAATRRTPAQLAALADRLDALAASDGHPATAVQHDFAFHRLVAEAAGNRFLLQALDRLGPQMIAMPRGRLDRYERDRPDAGRFAAVVHEHRVVLEALEAQDPLAAAAAMRVHLAGSRRRLIEESAPPRRRT
ncbi:GntR family transcriptional regulator, transcriptional repressor for pyruvate dehydrogenase complex [Promicromonospora umidemergens]|uniref:FadR/GntR family transcriptional regulator n=1 Tax=Promicromonospora umidemergens TaxID=629679 RepID=A0ABP8XWE7_9MICO|nr:FCD domain-containing protein [Promicromonospora umidemergens]MCP2286175.1 GntR family transcriptional regulator, transcriptional repressor for pyruvate dehydrogenase complex [Promicromonospora umidemergens]